MCADRAEPSPVSESASSENDPTLTATLGEPGTTFPDTAEGTRVVLYQTQQGDIELRWHLEAEALGHAQAMFGDGRGAPTPVLRLQRRGGAGRTPIAEAGLGQGQTLSEGIARYTADGSEGLVQAEVGLTNASGGWALVARSNQLQVVAPVGLAFLPLADNAARAGPSPPGSPEPMRLVPEFPQVKPRHRMAPSVDKTQDRERWDGLLGPFAGARSAVEAQGSTVTPVPALPAEPPDRAILESSDAPPSPTPQQQPAERIQPRLDRGPDVGDDPPTPHRVEAELRLPSGSGPAESIRPVNGATIRAELLIQGSAAPGKLLDLGGHAYRVGPGGRFAFRLPIVDPVLIMKLLSALPELPVAPRGGETSGDESEP